MLKRTAALLAVTLLLAWPLRPAAQAPGVPQDTAATQQVLRRFTFGPRPGEVERVQRLGLRNWFEHQLDAQFVPDPKMGGYLQRVPRNGQGRNASERELIAEKLMRAIYSERQLQEVMVDFWFNHFNVYEQKVRTSLGEYERDVIRPRALGNFRDMLRAVAHSRAMMVYLDNNVSVGPHSPDAEAARRDGRTPPTLNENYGRELLELHTLGVDGGYSQHDVVETARVFSGWGTSGDAFMYNSGRHDAEDKTVLGALFAGDGGMAQGDRLLDMLAVHSSTAEHIAYKLCRRFVSDDPPRAMVYRVAGAFRGSGGDIKTTLREIFYSPEFYSTQFKNAKTRSPLEYEAAAVRAVRAEVNNTTSLADHLRKMGEPLYECQPPTGYGDRADVWVNTGSFLDRVNFASELCHNEVPGVHVEAAAQIKGLDPNHWVEDLGKSLLGELTPQTRAGIYQVSPPGTRPTPALAADVLALIVGSPEFQKR